MKTSASFNTREDGTAAFTAVPLTKIVAKKLRSSAVQEPKAHQRKGGGQGRTWSLPRH